MSATLAARVKAARDAAGLSQRQLPGVDSGLLSRIETGKVKDPAISTLTAIAKATGTTVDQLNGAPASAVRSIELRDLLPDPKNPRVMQEGDAADQAFMQSIKDQGLLQPLAVRHTLVDNIRVWMVVDGHRRYAALVQIHGPRSKVLVPCRIIEADDTQTLLLQLVANVQRADMNPWDLSRAIGDLVDQKMDTQAIADALGRKRRWVQEMASVGRQAAESVEVSLRGGTISISQAVALVAERNGDQQNQLCARAINEKLNEDEIRAITADRKAKQQAADDGKQLDIEEFAAGSTKDKYPTPNISGVFSCKPTFLARWPHKRGHFEVRLVQFANKKWAAAADTEWRLSGGPPGGGRSGLPSRNHHCESSAALAFLLMARDRYPQFVECAKRWPEDVPAVTKLHEWIVSQLGNLKATPAMIEAWRKDYPPPPSPRAQAAAKPARAPAPTPEPPPIDTTEPPEWARPMVGALFMYHDGGSAWLCKGWRHMVKTVVELGEDEPHDIVEQLYQRDKWESDVNGEPYDFGSSVVRLKDAPA